MRILTPKQCVHTLSNNKQTLAFATTLLVACTHYPTITAASTTGNKLTTIADGSTLLIEPKEQKNTGDPESDFQYVYHPESSDMRYANIGFQNISNIQNTPMYFVNKALLSDNFSELTASSHAKLGRIDNQQNSSISNITNAGTIDVITNTGTISDTIVNLDRATIGLISNQSMGSIAKITNYGTIDTLSTASAQAITITNKSSLHILDLEYTGTATNQQTIINEIEPTSSVTATLGINTLSTKQPVSITNDQGSTLNFRNASLITGTNITLSNVGTTKFYNASPITIPSSGQLTITNSGSIQSTSSSYSSTTPSSALSAILSISGETAGSQTPYNGLLAYTHETGAQPLTIDLNPSYTGTATLTSNSSSTSNTLTVKHQDLTATTPKVTLDGIGPITYQPISTDGSNSNFRLTAANSGTKTIGLNSSRYTDDYQIIFCDTSNCSPPSNSSKAILVSPPDSSAIPTTSFIINTNNPTALDSVTVANTLTSLTLATSSTTAPTASDTIPTLTHTNAMDATFTYGTTTNPFNIQHVQNAVTPTTIHFHGDRSNYTNQANNSAHDLYLCGTSGTCTAADILLEAAGNFTITNSSGASLKSITIDASYSAQSNTSLNITNQGTISNHLTASTAQATSITNSGNNALIGTLNLNYTGTGTAASNQQTIINGLSSSSNDTATLGINTLSTKQPVSITNYAGNTLNFKDASAITGTNITLSNAGTTNFYNASPITIPSSGQLAITNSGSIQSTSSSYSITPNPALSATLPISGTGTLTYTHETNAQALTIDLNPSYTGTATLTSNSSSTSNTLTVKHQDLTATTPKVTLQGTGLITYQPISTSVSTSNFRLNTAGTGTKTIGLNSSRYTNDYQIIFCADSTCSSHSSSSKAILVSPSSTTSATSFIIDTDQPFELGNVTVENALTSLQLTTSSTDHPTDSDTIPTLTHANATDATFTYGTATNPFSIQHVQTAATNTSTSIYFYGDRSSYTNQANNGAHDLYLCGTSETCSAADILLEAAGNFTIANSSGASLKSITIDASYSAQSNTSLNITNQGTIDALSTASAQAISIINKGSLPLLDLEHTDTSTNQQTIINGTASSSSVTATLGINTISTPQPVSITNYQGNTLNFRNANLITGTNITLSNVGTTKFYNANPIVIPNTGQLTITNSGSIQSTSSSYSTSSPALSAILSISGETAESQTQYNGSLAYTHETGAQALTIDLNPSYTGTATLTSNSSSTSNTLTVKHQDLTATTPKVTLDGIGPITYQPISTLGSTSDFRLNTAGTGTKTIGLNSSRYTDDYQIIFCDTSTCSPPSNSSKAILVSPLNSQAIPTTSFIINTNNPTALNSVTVSNTLTSLTLATSSTTAPTASDTIPTLTHTNATNATFTYGTTTNPFNIQHVQNAVTPTTIHFHGDRSNYTNQENNSAHDLYLCGTSGTCTADILLQAAGNFTITNESGASLNSITIDASYSAQSNASLDITNQGTIAALTASTAQATSITNSGNNASIGTLNLNYTGTGAAASNTQTIVNGLSSSSNDTATLGINTLSTKQPVSITNYAGNTLNFKDASAITGTNITLSNAGTTNFYKASPITIPSSGQLAITNSASIQSTSSIYNDNPNLALSAILPISGTGRLTYTHETNAQPLTIDLNPSYTGTATLTSNSSSTSNTLTVKHQDLTATTPKVTLQGTGLITYQPISTSVSTSNFRLNTAGTGTKTIGLNSSRYTNDYQIIFCADSTCSSHSSSSKAILVSPSSTTSATSFIIDTDQPFELGNVTVENALTDLELTISSTDIPTNADTIPTLTHANATDAIFTYGTTTNPFNIQHVQNAVTPTTIHFHGDRSNYTNQANNSAHDLYLCGTSGTCTANILLQAAGNFTITNESGASLNSITIDASYSAQSNTSLNITNQGTISNHLTASTAQATSITNSGAGASIGDLNLSYTGTAASNTQTIHNQASITSLTASTAQATSITNSGAGASIGTLDLSYSGNDNSNTQTIHNQASITTLTASTAQATSITNSGSGASIGALNLSYTGSDASNQQTIINGTASSSSGSATLGINTLSTAQPVSITNYAGNTLNFKDASSITGTNITLTNYGAIQAFSAPIPVLTGGKLVVTNHGTMQSTANAYSASSTLSNHQLKITGQGDFAYQVPSAASGLLDDLIFQAGQSLQNAVVLNNASSSLSITDHSTTTATKATLSLGGSGPLHYQPTLASGATSGDFYVSMGGSGSKTISLPNSNQNIFFCASKDCASETTSLSNATNTNEFGFTDNDNTLYIATPSGSSGTAITSADEQIVPAPTTESTFYTIAYPNNTDASALGSIYISSSLHTSLDINYSGTNAPSLSVIQANAPSSNTNPLSYAYGNTSNPIHATHTQKGVGPVQISYSGTTSTYINDAANSAQSLYLCGSTCASTTIDASKSIQLKTSQTSQQVNITNKSAIGTITMDSSFANPTSLTLTNNGTITSDPTLQNAQAINHGYIDTLTVGGADNLVVYNSYAGNVKTFQVDQPTSSASTSTYAIINDGTINTLNAGPSNGQSLCVFNDHKLGSGSSLGSDLPAAIDVENENHITVTGAGNVYLFQANNPASQTRIINLSNFTGNAVIENNNPNQAIIIEGKSQSTDASDVLLAGQGPVAFNFSASTAHHATQSALTFNIRSGSANGIRGFVVDNTNNLISRDIYLLGETDAAPTSSNPYERTPLVIQENPNTYLSGSSTAVSTSCQTGQHIAASANNSVTPSVFVIIDDKSASTATIGDVFIKPNFNNNLTIQRINKASGTPLSTPTIYYESDTPTNITLDKVAANVQVDGTTWPLNTVYSIGQAASFINNDSTSSSTHTVDIYDLPITTNGTNTNTSSSATYIVADASAPLNYTMNTGATQGTLTLHSSNRSGNMNFINNSGASTALTIANQGDLSNTLTLIGPGAMNINNNNGATIQNVVLGGSGHHSITNRDSSTLSGTIYFGQASTSSTTHIDSGDYAFTNEAGGIIHPSSTTAPETIIIQPNATGTLSITNNESASILSVTAHTPANLNIPPSINLVGDGPIAFTPTNTHTANTFKYVSFAGPGDKTLNLSNISAIAGAPASVPVLITGSDCSASSSSTCTVTPGAIALHSSNGTNANIHLQLGTATNIGTIRANNESNASLIHVSSSTSSHSSPTQTTFVNEANSNIQFSGSNDFILKQRNATWKNHLLLGTDSQLSGITKATYQIETIAPTVGIDITGAETPRAAYAIADTPSSTKIVNSNQLSSDLTISSYVSMENAPISIDSIYGNPIDDSTSSLTRTITLSYHYVGSSTSSTQSTTSSVAMNTTNNAVLSALNVQGNGSQSITNQSTITQGVSIHTAYRTSPTITIINQPGGVLGTDVNTAMNTPIGQYLDPSANPATFINNLYTGYLSPTANYPAIQTQANISGSIDLYNQNPNFLSFNAIQKTSLQQFQLHGTSGILAVGDVCNTSHCGTGTPTSAAVNTIIFKASSTPPSSTDASTTSSTTASTDSTSASTDTATASVTTSASTTSTTETSEISYGNGDPTALFVFPGATVGTSNMPLSFTSINLSDTYNADVFILQGSTVYGNIDIGSVASNNRITMLQHSANDDLSSEAIHLVIKTSDTNTPLSQILTILNYDSTTSTYLPAQGYHTVNSALSIGDNLYQVVALPVQIGTKQLSDQRLLNLTHTTNQWLIQNQPAGMSYTNQSIDHSGHADTSILTAAYPWDWSSGQAHTRMVAAFEYIQTQHHAESGSNRFEQNLTDINAQLLLGHKLAWLSDTGWMHHTQWVGNGMMLSMQPTVSVGIGKSRLHRHYNTLQTDEKQINVDATGRYWHAFASTGLELGSYYIMQDTSRVGLRSYSTLSLGMQPEYQEKDGPFYQWKWQSRTFSALYSQIGLDFISTAPEQGMSTRIGINALMQASLDQNIRFTNQQDTRESFSYHIPGLRRAGGNVQVTVSYSSFDMTLGYDMLRNWNNLKGNALNQWHARLHWRGI